MTGGIEPDFRTVSDFRKNNIDSLKEIFHEFNHRISGAVEWGFFSVDGSKIQATNGWMGIQMNILGYLMKWMNMKTMMKYRKN